MEKLDIKKIINIAIPSVYDSSLSFLEILQMLIKKMNEYGVSLEEFSASLELIYQELLKFNQKIADEVKKELQAMYVDGRLNELVGGVLDNKADKSQIILLQQDILLKADKTLVDTKADKTLVDTKADKTLVDTKEDKQPLINRCNILVLGDSNTVSGDSFGTFLQNITGANVRVAGFGGTRASSRTDVAEWSHFSFCNLAKAIQTDNYNSQNNVVENVMFPNYFPHSLNVLKTTDFNSLDYIVLNYGANDYTGNVKIASEPYNDLFSFSGALRMGMEYIQTTYPHIQFIILSTAYRMDVSPSSDVWLNSLGHTGLDYNTCLSAMALEFKAIYIDVYSNVFNHRSINNFLQNDKIHFTDKMNIVVANRIAKVIDLYD